MNLLIRKIFLVLCLFYLQDSLGDTPFYYESDGFRYSVFDGAAEIIGCVDSCDTDLVIPEEINNIPVLSIGYDAFSGQNLNSVSFSQNLINISDDAFKDNNLTSLNIPENIKAIGAGAFSENNFTNIQVPESLLYSINNISQKFKTFDVSGITFGNNDFLPSAFYDPYDYDGMANIAIQSGSWKYFVINQKAILLDYTVCPPPHLEIPESIDGYPVTIIMTLNLRSPFCLLSFRPLEFQIAESITIPEGVKIIGPAAFISANFKFDNINLPNGLLHIGSAAFQLSNTATHIELPDSIQSIGMDAFRFPYCYKDFSIEFTAKDAVFSLLVNLMRPCYGNISSQESVILTHFSTNSGHNEIPSIIDGKKVIGIGREAIDCFREDVTSIKIPEGVVAIGNNAFRESCDSLSEIILPTSIDTIGKGAFSALRNLTSINLPYGIENIAPYLFYETGIREITIPASVKSIDSKAFYYYLETVHFLGDRPTINPDSFSSNLQSVTYCPKENEKWPGNIFGYNLPDYYLDPESPHLVGGVTPTESPNCSIASWDMDLDGSVDPLTDALLILRYAFGFRNQSLTESAISEESILTSIEVANNVEQALGIADIDNNGIVDALTDGLLLLRYSFGLRGNRLVSGVISLNAVRTSAADIEAYIESHMP